MPEPLLLCVIPAERAQLAPIVLAAGGTPVIDLTCSPATVIPEGAWVRTRAGRDAPGTGPVLLAEGETPIPGRPTWREVTSPGPAPLGFAGLVLRGIEAGGRGGDLAGLDLLAEMPPRTPVVLDAALSPEEAARAIAAGAEGVVLSDVLLAQPELGLPPGVAAAVAAAGHDSSRRAGGVRVLAPPLSPVMQRLAAGSTLWAEAEGWFEADAPADRAVPAGLGVPLGRALAARGGGIAGLIAAYRSALRAGRRDAAMPVVQSVMPVLQDLVAAVAAALARPGDAPAQVSEASTRASEVEVLCTGLAVGLPGAERAFQDQALGALAEGAATAGGGVSEAGSPSGLRMGGFDLCSEYGLSPARAGAMDGASRLAVAVGLEALMDAGLPLVLDANGVGGRGLPEPLRAGTGVIFASGGRVRGGVADEGAGQSDAHATLADVLGVTGPGVGLSAGAASAAAAIATGLDWIRLGRAERVIVVAADDGGGAHGSNPGGAGRRSSAGAAGFVLESGSSAARRGAAVRARLARAVFGSEADRLPAELEGAFLAVGEPAAARLVERSGRAALVGHRASEPSYGYAPAAGLDDALAVLAVTETGAGGLPLQALRAAPAPGGGLVALTWAHHADYDAAMAIPWLTTVTGLREPIFARTGRVVYAVGRGSSPPAHPGAPPAAPAPVVAPPSPWTVSAPPVAAPPAQTPLPPLPATELRQPLPELPVEAPARPAPVAPRPSAPARPASFARPSEQASPKVTRTMEDAEDRAASKLAAWSKRVKSKRGGKKSGESSRTADWMALARARVFREMLILLARRRGENSTLPSSSQRLGADLSMLADEQADLLIELGARYDLDLETSEVLTGDPSLEQIVAWLVDEARTVWRESPEAPAGLRRLFAVDDSPADDDGASGETTDQIQVRASVAHDRSTEAVLLPVSAPAEAVAQLVAAEVGYRPDELLPNLELEGDLGLDQGARSRIIEGLRQRFRLGASAPEEPVTLVTLTRWASDGPQVGEAAGDAPLEAGPTPAEAPERAEASAETSPIPVAVAHPAAPEPVVEAAQVQASEGSAPLPDLTEMPPEDDSSGAVVVAEQPARPVGPLPPAPPLPESFRVRRVVLVNQALSAVGSVKGRVVRVLGDTPLAHSLRTELAARGASGEGSADAVIDAGDDVSASYEVARTLAEAPPRDWVAVSVSGGQTTPEQALSVGARAGLAKSLRREWPRCRARHLQISSDLDRAEAVLVTLEELSSGDDALEVLRGPGPRKVSALAVEPSPPRAMTGALRRTVIVVGGTRGVGAALALAVARRGERIVLVARTTPARKPYDEAAARAAVERGLRARGRRPSETRILRGLEPYRMAEEARKTVQRLRDVGAEVLFVKADLADAASTDAAAAEIRRLVGGVDGLIVALPMGETEQLSAREPGALSTGAAPRLTGVNLLRQALTPQGWLLSVGSLGGRFGQAGRIEVCAGLQAMASLCSALPRALHVSCPAWQDGGRSDEAPGADPLPLEAGVEVLLDLVSAGATGERVLSGRLGPGVLNPGHALLEAMDVDGDAVEVWCDLSPDEAPWLAEYAVDGVPQLPLAVSVELLCAAARLANPGNELGGFSGLRAVESLRVPLGDRARVLVRARPTGETTASATLFSVHDGGRRVRHVELDVLLGPVQPPGLLPSAFFPEESISRSQIYRRFFQGSTFQVLRDAGAVAAEGLLVDAVVEHASIATDLVSAPLVLEAAIQGALLHHMAVDSTRALPASVDGVWLLRSPPDGDPLELMVQRVDDAWDIDIHGPEGAIMRVRGLRLRDVGVLGPLERFPEPDGGWPSAVVGLALG